MAVREVLFAAGAAGAALWAGAETRPAQIVGEASMSARDDGSYATHGDQMDCLGAAMQGTAETDAASENETDATAESESSEEVLPDPDCYPADSSVPNADHARVEALEVLGYPADVQVYVTDGNTATKPPEDGTIMNELREARHGRASTRARWLGGFVLGMAGAGAVIRRRFGGDDHASH